MSDHSELHTSLLHQQSTDAVGCQVQEHFLGCIGTKKEASFVVFFYKF